MILVGLTGGIGSGKSTVGAQLVSHGAVLIDADLIVRELQRPGTEVFERIVAEFGDGVVTPNGTLDRAALAAVVFGDAERLTRLNAIVHPAVQAEMARRIEAQRSGRKVVILDIPLLVENPRRGLSATLVVDVDPGVAVARVVAQRGGDEADTRARVARQASRSARRLIADWIIDNSGSRLDLAHEVARAWRWMQTLPHV
ncbi:MAG: dephospho-CoA kinase [Actinobacteria bacterium]|nr:dephospho-CoA kinase [Actinomycetota bacterium]NDG76231.1 dephospho-CoA kinase [Acidimicrobiia bacterium]NBO32966.1 dephospho-CoA kinase [Actinomycetota bacterium]NBP17809.1 dephospho-CoA kinase [Actinomycetota bacterium]NBT21161.1 dephospho-CoA kinase [Actinomycetota bacterium]